jgi:hypothetical protein
MQQLPHLFDIKMTGAQNHRSRQGAPQIKKIFGVKNKTENTVSASLLNIAFF